jgi:putative endonuclease
MKYFVYIIFSSKLNKYYTGFTENLEVRLEQHNSGISTFTAKGIPWVMVYNLEVNSANEARQLEKIIKGRGAKRFLIDKNII